MSGKKEEVVLGAVTKFSLQDLGASWTCRVRGWRSEKNGSKMSHLRSWVDGGDIGQDRPGLETKIVHFNGYQKPYVNDT